MNFFSCPVMDNTTVSYLYFPYHVLATFWVWVITLSLLSIMHSIFCGFSLLNQAALFAAWIGVCLLLFLALYFCFLSLSHPWRYVIAVLTILLWNNSLIQAKWVFFVYQLQALTLVKYTARELCSTNLWCGLVTATLLNH